MLYVVNKHSLVRIFNFVVCKYSVVHTHITKSFFDKVLDIFTNMVYNSIVGNLKNS